MSAESIAQAFGPAAAIVIVALTTVVLYLFKDSRAREKSYNELQEKRLAEALETQDKLVKLVEEQKELPERIYNLALSRKGKRD